jgi:hypothetical protein
LFLPILLAGFVLPLFWPEIRRLPAWHYDFAAPWQAGAVDGLIGILAGVIFAATGSLLRILAGRGWPNFAPVAMMAAVGAVLGWQLMLLVTPAIVLVYVAAAIALWLLGPLPHVAAEPPATTESDSAASQELGPPPESAEPPLPAISSERELPS